MIFVLGERAVREDLADAELPKLSTCQIKFTRLPGGLCFFGSLPAILWLVENFRSDGLGNYDGLILSFEDGDVSGV